MDEALEGQGLGSRLAAYALDDVRSLYNGAKVRYVQLPAEAHGYRARESIGHTLYEMVNWLDTYVKPTRPISSR